MDINSFYQGAAGGRNTAGPMLPPCAYLPADLPCMRQSPQITRQPYSYLRLLHAAPGAPPVDVYANNSLIASGLPYKGFTEYLQVMPATYRIQVFRAGTTGPVLLDTVIEVPGQSINTAAVVGVPANLTIKTFFETVVQIPPGQIYLRFANLVPDGPDMDLVLSNGTELFSDVSFGMATNYTQIPAGTYIFYLQQSGTARSLLYVPNIHLLPGRFYTIYAVGRMDGTVPLQVLIPLDGNSYIQI
jgi:hypothetical protein